MARSTRTRIHSVTHLNAYSCQCAKLSESDLPMRQLKWAEGLKQVKEGNADWEYGRGGAIKGIRFREKQRAQNPTPCTLDVRVLKSVSGEGLAGPHDNGSHEGAEEGLRNKFMVWPLIGDDRAVCVRPRISVEDRLRAEKLLGLKAA